MSEVYKQKEWFAPPSTLNEMTEILSHGHKNVTEKKHNPN
jgi:hypothetical protein